MHKSPSLEIWGGVECSRVRLRDRIVDQISRTGHDHRLDDLDRFAALGLRTLRTPILWERHAQEPIDWAWADAYLGRIRELGLRPIVGFVHHGGGPLPGGLLDPGFVEGLARFAGKFARRYPWVDAYNPVNEPLTTARFSGLYGLWHPFGATSAKFARILLNECEGIRAAMREIRSVTPHAILVQTEDLGKTHSTKPLAYQADFENERRWLTFDLLAGKLTRARPMWKHLRACGLTEAELKSFLTDPCPPDIYGANYYVTSERFIDRRLQRYPEACRGGNEREAYADVPAVRVRKEGLLGLERLLDELWQRYRSPIAVTEVQMACTREEQLRWIDESWRAAQHLRERGVDVRAITAWALLGGYDWSTLLVENRGDFEVGAFDSRSDPPRLTAVARALAGIAAEGNFDHPAVSGPGWWRRRMRFEFPAVSVPYTGSAAVPAPPEFESRERRPILVLGASGALGGAFIRLCHVRGLDVIGLTRRELDLTDRTGIREHLGRMRPWAVINAAGLVRIEQAERDPDLAMRTNALGNAFVAEACAEWGCAFLTFSSSQVFDGRSSRPYRESDLPVPLNHYGRSKLEAERRVAQVYPASLMVRTSALFGPWDKNNFAVTTLNRLSNRTAVHASNDVVISPSYTPDVANAALDLLIDGESGCWHVANAGETTWFEWARSLAERAGCPTSLVVPASAREMGWMAPRPRRAVLASERGNLLPSWTEAMERFLVEHALEGRRSNGASLEPSTSEMVHVPHMEPYQNSSSGVRAFAAVHDGIVVQFQSGEAYLYTHSSAGRKNIALMKQMARAGRGLATFISREVHDRHERRLASAEVMGL